MSFVTVELGIGQLLQIRKVESWRSNSRSSSVIVFLPPVVVVVVGSWLLSLLLWSASLNQSISREEGIKEF